MGSLYSRNTASTAVNRLCLNVVLLQQQILWPAVMEVDRRTGQSTWHSRAVKTFHKNSEWNPDWHAPSIQNKWLLLTCPIGTYILIAGRYQRLLWGFQYPPLKTARPLTAIFQDCQQYHRLCSHINSFPTATELDHWHQSSFINSPRWVVLSFCLFFFIIDWLGLRKGEWIYRPIPNSQASFSLNYSHWQLHL